VGVSDSTPRRSTADGWVHPQRLVCRNPYKGVRKTAKTWQLGWGLPAGRKATTPFLRGRPRGPQGQSKSDPAPAWDAPPAVAARRVDGPARGLGRTEGRRSLGVDTARKGEHARPRMGPNQHPANRSTREELCHRVRHHRDAHRAWNPTAEAVGGGQYRATFPSGCSTSAPAGNEFWGEKPSIQYAAAPPRVPHRCLTRTRTP
jgi:hypothetical protein